MKSGLKTLGMWLILGVIFVVLLVTIIDGSNTKMTYSELITKMEQSDVKEIEISYDGNKAYVTLKDNSKKVVNIPNLYSFMNYSQDALKAGTINLSEKNQSIIITLLSLLTPFGLLIIFLIFWFLTVGGAQQGGNKTVSFGKSKARLMGTADKNRVTFEDVAGVVEEKEELEEIV